jgi:adenine nucleotide transporter 17
MLIANPKEKSAIAVLLNIIKAEGYAGLFSGLSPMLVSLGSSNFVFFYWHTALKAAVRAARPPSERHLDVDVLTSLFLAFLAGCINVIMTSPLWVAFTRIMGKQDKYGQLTIFQALSLITKEEGIASLWSGLGPSLVLVSNPTIQFVTFEKLKSAILRTLHGVELNQDKDSMLETINNEDAKVDENDAIEFIKQTAPELTSVQAFIVGGLSKLVATILTYPLQVAQTEMRAGGKYKGTVHCLKTIYEKEGIQGWFKGFSAKIVQTVLTSAAMFLLYEKISHAIFIFLVRRRIRASKV